MVLSNNFHPYDELKHLLLTSNKQNAKHQILIMGVPHLSKPLGGLKVIHDLILNFAPDLISIENLPPDAPYKEDFYNRFYGRGIGDLNWYSSLIDAARKKIDITPDQAQQIITHSRPVDPITRARLAHAHLVNKDEVNSAYQWYLLEREKTVGTARQIDALLLQQPHFCHNIWNNEIGQIAFPVAATLHIKHIFGMDCQIDREANDALLQKGSLLLKRSPAKVIRLLSFIPFFIRSLWASLSGGLIFYMNTWNAIKMLASFNKAIYTSSPILEEWHQHYLIRNRLMVENIVNQVRDQKSNRAFVMVGASHVSYFLCMLRELLPEAQLYTLDQIM